MRTNDVIVIGGGLAGLTAAIAAAGRGKQVALLTAGAGTLAIGGGTIDVLGYLEDNSPVDSPAAALGNLAADHPYSKVGPQAVAAAVEFFLDLCRQAGFAYTGTLAANHWLPTAAGTLKPSCLLPLTMDPAPLATASHVLVAGFARLKDYFPDLVGSGLRTHAGRHREYEPVLIDPGFAGGRDVTALDIARWLDTPAGQQACYEQLARFVRPGSVVVIPPVLGVRPDYEVRNKLEQALACSFVETVIMPTAITGLRLRALLVNHARKLGVRILEQAHAAWAVQTGGRVAAIVTDNMDRERAYRTEAVILATGGFWGGGITAGPDAVQEAVLHLPVQAPADREDWGGLKLFGGPDQPFARIGLQVNSELRPVDAGGRVMLENVYIAGRNLAGYDYCREKSGNGVALVTGYTAGMNC